MPDIATEVVARGIVADISGTTIWRWLSQDAIRPWRSRSWIFPRDPGFGCFWVVDNGSSHRGQRAVDRMRQRWSNARLVQLPRARLLAHPGGDDRRSTSLSCSARS